MKKGLYKADGSLLNKSEHPDLFKSLRDDFNKYTPNSFKIDNQPNNSVLKYFVVFKQRPPYLIGSIFQSYSTPNFALECNGAIVKISKFLDLYLVIGDMFSVEEVKLNTFKNKVLDKFSFLRKYFRYDIQKKRLCEECQFCLPDLRV